MNQYLHGLKTILEKGQLREDRTGTGTISVFGMQQRYDLSEGFPAVTTKKLAWRAVVSELLWFIEGSGDERRLCEILHGTRDSSKTTIWTANAEAGYWKDKAKFSGDLGRVYGTQWRSWGKYSENTSNPGTYIETPIDQLSSLIDGIKKDPYSRRHILSAWNVAELDQMALPPCHILAQFYVSSDSKLSCSMYQRSNDYFLGCAFNIASYSLLTHMIARECGLDVGEFIHTSGDAHIYTNHIEQVKTQLERNPLPLPTLLLNPDVKRVVDFTMEDIKLVDYQSHDAIKAPMAV